jgi:phage shock protein A
MAVEAGDDDLARKALTRKKDYEKIRDALKDQAKASNEAVRGLRRQFDGMVAKLAEAERRLGTLTARCRAAEIRVKFARQSASLATDLESDAFDKFDRLTRKVEIAEAEAEAMAELAGVSEEDDFVKLESGDDDVDDELERMKRDLESDT